MHPILSWEESWFPGFYCRGRTSFHKHLNRCVPSAIGMWEGPWVCCLKSSGCQDSLSRKKVGFPSSRFNAGSSFISQDTGMSEFSVQSLEKALGPLLIWTGGLTSLNTSRGGPSSMFQKVTMPDNSWKLIEIPISLCQLESDAWSPASPPEASILSCQA